LQNVIHKTSKGDVFVLTGILNAKVREDKTDTAGVTGKFGYGKRNVRSDRLIDLCKNKWALHRQHEFQIGQRKQKLNLGIAL